LSLNSFSLADRRIRPATKNTRNDIQQQSAHGSVERDQNSRNPSPHPKRMKINSGEMPSYVPAKLKGARDQYGRLATPNSPEDFYYHLSPTLKMERKKYIKTSELKKSGRGQHAVSNIASDAARLQQFMAIVSTRLSQETPFAATSVHS
jgi:hypothetical protein